MNEIESRIKNIEEVFKVEIQTFINTHIIFAMLSIYIENYCKIPRN